MADWMLWRPTRTSIGVSIQSREPAPKHPEAQIFPAYSPSLPGLMKRTTSQMMLMKHRGNWWTISGSWIRT